MSQWAAVLAGGSGTRFWPLSTPRSPKQMLALAGPAPLLVQSVRRLAGLIPPERTLVITSDSLAAATRALLPEIPRGNVLAEPRAASTGPALAWGTSVVSQRDAAASLLALHADWAVADDAAFREAGARALETAARFDLLVAVGLVPTRPETGYGYIQPGARLDGDAARVERFIEKPDLETTARLIAGGALWNSGMFAWTAPRFFAETEAVAPEIAPHLPALRAGDVAGFYARVQPVAIDRSHFERSRRVAVIPGGFRWDDVGTWSALARVRPADSAGNTLVGDVTPVESRGCVAWSSEGPVVLFGVHDLVVVRANGTVLVTTRERASELKRLLEALPQRLREPSE